MTGNQDNQQSDGNSVPPVMFHLGMNNSTLHVQNSALVKCGKCDTVTEHTTVKITPLTINPANNPLEILKLAKRLTMCTHCGNLRLTN